MPEDFHDEIADQIRSASSVARRCVVLYGVLAAGHGVLRDQIAAWLRSEGLWDVVSPDESAFLLSESPTHQQQVNATWRAEALFPLLWSLGLIPDLPSPQQLCDVPLIQRVLPPLFEPVGEFIASARLRSDSEVYAASEEIYQIHWRVRDARLRGQPTSPGSLARMPREDSDPPVESYIAGVVQERHHALNWLIGYCGQDWDEITTDT
jgi:hypothetical protein